MLIAVDGVNSAGFGMLRFRKVRVFMLVTVVAMVAVSVSWYQSTQKIRPLSERTKVRMRDIRIGPLQKDETVGQIINRFNAALAAKHETRGLRVRVWHGEMPPREFHRRASTGRSTGIDIHASAWSRQREQPQIPGIDLIHPENLRGEGVLLWFNGMCDSSVGEKGDTIYLVPGDGTFEPIVRRTYSISAEDWEFWLRRSDSTSAEEVLRKEGVTSYEGTDAQFKSTGKLIVENTEREQKLCDFFFGRQEQSFVEKVRKWIKGMRNW